MTRNVEFRHEETRRWTVTQPGPMGTVEVAEIVAVKGSEDVDIYDLWSANHGGDGHWRRVQPETARLMSHCLYMASIWADD